MKCPFNDAECKHPICIDCHWTIEQHNHMKENLRLNVEPLRKDKDTSLVYR